MDRRDCLKAAVPAVAALALGLAGCVDDTSPEKPAGLPTLNFVTRDPAYSDYRASAPLEPAATIPGTPPVQLTEVGYEAQHAKFFPSGDRLNFTALQPPRKAGPRGIAWIDISSYIR